MSSTRLRFAPVVLALVLAACAAEPRGPTNNGEYPLPAGRDDDGMAAQPEDLGWPQRIVDAEDSVMLYPPHATAWASDRLSGRLPGADGNLRYATNSDTPVLEAAKQYYALSDGVWFVGPTPTGPWTVATTVPESVYSIPPSSPIYYTTYVRVYDVTPDYVYFGYTPGYYGAYYSDGVVVWGTGYRYRPWVGGVWYGRPVTWGYGVGFGFGPASPRVGSPGMGHTSAAPRAGGQVQSAPRGGTLRPSGARPGPAPQQRVAAPARPASKMPRSNATRRHSR